MIKGDKEWLDELAASYEWPSPSCDLKQRIVDKCRKKTNVMNMIGVLIFQRETFLALLLALVLGVGSGYTTGSNVYSDSSETSQSHIYTGSGMTLAENFMGIE